MAPQVSFDSIGKRPKGPNAAYSDGWSGCTRSGTFRERRATILRRSTPMAQEYRRGQTRLVPTHSPGSIWAHCGHTNDTLLDSFPQEMRLARDAQSRMGLRLRAIQRGLRQVGKGTFSICANGRSESEKGNVGEGCHRRNASRV